MEPRTILPLIDMLLLSMGALLALMVHMRFITALPVDVTRVEPGAAAVQQGELKVVSLTDAGISLDGDPITLEALEPLVASERLVLRIQRDLPTEDGVGLLAKLVQWNAEVALEVMEDSPTIER